MGILKLSNTDCISSDTMFNLGENQIIRKYKIASNIYLQFGFNINQAFLQS